MTTILKWFSIAIIVLGVVLSGLINHVQASTLTTEFLQIWDGLNSFPEYEGFWVFNDGRTVSYFNFDPGWNAFYFTSVSADLVVRAPWDPVIITTSVEQPGEYSKEYCDTGEIFFGLHLRRGWIGGLPQPPTDLPIGLLVPLTTSFGGDITTKVVQEAPWYIDKVTYSFKLIANGKTSVFNLEALDSSNLNTPLTEIQQDWRMDGNIGYATVPIETWNVYSEGPEEALRYYAIPEFGPGRLDAALCLTQTVHVVPLPSTAFLLGSGLLLLAFYKRRKLAFNTRDRFMFSQNEKD
jgi:hypothetical protein